MYGCESWTIKKVEHRRTDAFELLVLEKTLESPLDCKEIQPVHPEGNQSWIFIGRTDAEAEAPILWPHDVKNWLIGKGPDAGKDWGQEEKRGTEHKMVGWYHWLNAHELGQTLGDSEGQGSLAFCSPRGRKESDTTERLNWIDLQYYISFRYTVQQLFWYFYTLQKDHHNVLFKISLVFPGGPMVKNLPCNAGDTSSISGHEDPPCLKTTSTMCHNYWACTSAAYDSHKRNHRNEKPMHCNKE